MASLINITARGAELGFSATALADMSANPAQRQEHTRLAEFGFRGTEVRGQLVQRGDVVELHLGLRSDPLDRKPRATFMIPYDSEPTGPGTVKIAGSVFAFKVSNSTIGSLQLSFTAKEGAAPTSIKVWNKGEAPSYSAGIASSSIE